MSNAIRTKLIEPPIFHREYENDLGKSNSQRISMLDQCIRVTKVALPFIALYKPITQPLSIALGAARTISCASYLMEAIKSGEKSNVKYALLQTTISIVSLASEIFVHPVGILITTGQDLIINASQLAAALKNKNYKQALEVSAHILNNSLYLALFFTGALEIIAASLSVQILLGLYESSSEFKHGNYLEGCSQLLMAGIRTQQLKTHIGVVKMKWEMKALLEKIELNNPVIIDIILKYGGDPELVIFKAANAGDCDSVIKLLDYGFPYTTDKIEPVYGTKNWNVTDSSCRSNNIDLMEYLIKDRKILPTRDHFTYHVKSLEPNLKVIDFLLSKGYKFPPTIILDAFHESQYADHEFFKAKEIHDSKKPIKMPKIEFIQFLIERGAAVQDPKNHHKLSYEGGMEYIWHTLLHNMYVSKDPKTSEAREMIKLLIPHGLKADVRSKWMPYTPINLEVKQASNPYFSYTTPLGVAIQYEDIDFARLLLDAGANPKDITGYYKGFNTPKSKHFWKWEFGNSISLLDLSKNNKDIGKLLLEYWEL